jgi:hypothetical protein
VWYAGTHWQYRVTPWDGVVIPAGAHARHARRQHAEEGNIVRQLEEADATGMHEAARTSLEVVQVGPSDVAVNGRKVAANNLLQVLDIDGPGA